MIPMLILLAVGGLMQAARSFTLDTSIAGTELAFGYFLLSAYFTAKILSRFGLPKLTAYLVSGIISGPFVLGFVTKDMGGTLKVVSNAATAILALEAGAELELSKIRSVTKTLTGITIFAVIGAMFAITGALFLMRPLLPFVNAMDTTKALAVCTVVGVCLSAQSPAVVMALLAETRAEGPLSRVILASVVVADLCVIVMFSIASSVTSAVIGGGLDVVATTINVAWELFGSMIFGVLLGVVMSAFLRSVRQSASLFALLVCVVVAEIGGRVQLDPLIVLLSAGIYVRNYSKADPMPLIHSFEAAQLPVFLVFFALAGSKLNLGMLWSALLPVGIVCAVRASAFFVGARFACRITRADDVVTRYGWFGLVPQAGLALALALVLQRTFPSFGDAAAALLFGVVGFNELIAAPILRVMLVRSGEAGKKLGVDFAADGH